MELSERIAREVLDSIWSEYEPSEVSEVAAIIDRHLDALSPAPAAEAPAPLDEKVAANGFIGHLLKRNAQLQKRVKAFQEGYRDKAFEVTALEIQILDIKATGYNERLERNFESMKRRCLVAIEERNEARERIKELDAAAAQAGEGE